MRPVGAGVTNAVDHGHFALVVKVLNGCEGWVERQFIADGQDFFLGDAHRFPAIVIKRVLVGDDRVDVVVPAGQLDNYQDRVFVSARQLTVSCRAMG